MANLDRFDEIILQELKVDGRISNVKLAEKIGLSPSSCLRRVQELEKSGVIAGYRAILDIAKLDIGFIAYVAVGLSNQSKESQVAFEKVITESDEVIECHNITGTFEYLLRIETADLASYKFFHTDILGTLEHVNTITTHVVMGSPKDIRK